MSSETDLIKLYSTQILALAADIPHLGRMEDAGGTSKKRSPLCGSTVTVGLKLTDGRISEFRQDVKACALGQASASILGGVVLGLGRSDIAQGRDQLWTMLTENGPIPDAPFERFEVLQPARDYKNRHASIMLCFDATLGAIDDASS